MRTLLLGLIVFALGIGAAALAVSPGAGARTATVDGTITGHVGTSANNDAFSIGLSTGTVPAGTYEFDITDYSQMHNFDLCAGTSCTGSNSVGQTSISGTGLAVWTIALAPGTYFFRCDAHSSMHGTLVVTDPTTTSTTQTTTTATTTTTPALTLKITSITASRSKVTVAATMSQPSHVTASLLKKGVEVANASADGTSVKLILKPATKLAPGAYVVQVTAGQTVKKKKITIM